MKRNPTWEELGTWSRDEIGAAYQRKHKTPLPAKDRDAWIELGRCFGCVEQVEVVQSPGEQFAAWAFEMWPHDLSDAKLAMMTHKVNQLVAEARKDGGK